MAINPLDFLKNLVPDNTNIFGASPPEFSQRAKELGLLEEDALKKSKQTIYFFWIIKYWFNISCKSYE